MRKNKIVFLFWLIFCVFDYIYVNSWFSLALLSVTVGLLFLDIVIFSMGKRKIEINISTTGQCEKNELIEVRMTAKNSSFLPVMHGTIGIKAYNVITEETLFIEKSLSIRSKGTFLSSAIIKSENCGLIKLEISSGYVLDSLGLFKRKMKFNQGEDGYNYTVVQPTLINLNLEKNSLDTYNMESYNFSFEKSGNDPSETFGIREYRSGDILKTIHWKLTGKMDEIMVRELGLPIENSLMILLDKRINNNSIIDGEKRSRETELFLSLSKTFIEKDLKHSIGFMDYDKNQFRIKEISTLSSVYEIIGLVMSTPYKEDNISTIYHYLESDTACNYGNYIYVTSGNEEDLERLENYGGVTVYRTENYR